MSKIKHLSRPKINILRRHLVYAYILWYQATNFGAQPSLGQIQTALRISHATALADCSIMVAQEKLAFIDQPTHQHRIPIPVELPPVHRTRF